MTNERLNRYSGAAARLPVVRFGSKGPPARCLAEAVESAVERVDEGSLNGVARPEASPIFQARSLLGLLAFCYARQVYSSDTIAAQIKRDFAALQVDGDEFPDTFLLQRFRCENKGPLVFCLKSALLFLASEKVRQGLITHVKEPQILEEARRRIIVATFTDSLEMEERTEEEEDPSFKLSDGPWPFSLTRRPGDGQFVLGV
jgi:hypothetical protein